jgi:hypothetical protein
VDRFNEVAQHLVGLGAQLDASIDGGEQSLMIDVEREGLADGTGGDVELVLVAADRLDGFDDLFLLIARTTAGHEQAGDDQSNPG